MHFRFFFVSLPLQDSGITVKSHPLTVDTSQAIKMKPETSSENEENTNELSTNAEQSSDFTENYRRRLISVNDAEYRYKSLLLGICAALIAFLFILTVFCASRRNDDKTIEQQHSSSSGLLNEVITVRS